MESLMDCTPIEIAESIFERSSYTYEQTDDDTIFGFVPGLWGLQSIMVWHDRNNQYVNIHMAFDGLKFAKRKTNALLQVVNKLNLGLPFGTVTYDEEHKRLQFKYVIVTDRNDFVDPEVIDVAIETSVSVLTAVHFDCMMVASGACSVDNVFEEAKIYRHAGTA